VEHHSGLSRSARQLLASVVLCAVLVIPSVATAQRSMADSVSDAQAQAQQAQAQADALRKQQQGAQGHAGQLGNAIQSLTQTINALSMRENQLTLAIADLDAKLAAQQVQVALAQQQLDAIGLDLAAAQLKLVETQLQLAHDRSTLGGILRHLYEMGTTSTINAMLSSDTFDALWQKLIDQRRVANAEHDAVQTVKNEEALVQRTVAQIAADQVRQAAVVDQQRQIQAQIQQTRDQRAAAAAELARIIAADEAQRKLNEQSKAEADAQVAQLSAAVDAANKNVAAKKAAYEKAKQQAAAAAAGHKPNGKFVWPMSGDITQNFGCTPYYYEPYDPNCASRHFHSGLDIATSYGTPIVATASGVAYTYYSGYGYGNHIIIIDGDGFSSLYGHMSGFVVGNGQAVGQGQTIGYEGSSGNSTGPHLHFEIRWNDNPENPLNYLP
jgi:murein DD-endopeptidase MepM/ murein hydrolase activator NlpD